MANNNGRGKALESWIWDAACSIIRKLSDKIGEGVTTHMRAIAKENPGLQGIIDRKEEIEKTRANSRGTTCTAPAPRGRASR